MINSRFIPQRSHNISFEFYFNVLFYQKSTSGGARLQHFMINYGLIVNSAKTLSRRIFTETA